METYAINLYADGEIQWTTGDSSADGGVNGLGGNPAQVGFNRGDGTDFGVIPISGTANVIDIASTSNVGVDGMYIFRISDDPIETEYSKRTTYMCVHANDAYLHKNSLYTKCCV